MSEAARKAWLTRKKNKGSQKVSKTKVSKTKRKTSKGKMPENVKEYFQNISKGMSKTEARKAAGLPAKSKTRKKKWGPGHPLYDWQQKHKR